MTVLLHMPLATVLDTHHDASAERSERAVLRAVAGVVVTSEWTRRQVLTRYAIPACRVHVARPGVDRVAAPARPVRGHLICVGVLGRHKGQDLLVEALADLADRDWHCVLAGPLDRDPDFVEQLQTRITRDRKSTRLNSSHPSISYAVFCMKKKKKSKQKTRIQKKKTKKTYQKN